jgi:chromosome segregation ATPase
MNWDFLKLNRNDRGQDDYVPPPPRPAPAAFREEAPRYREETNIRMIAPLDQRAVNAARETVFNNLSDFENSLQELSRLPEQFRIVMAPIENAVNSMGILRTRLEAIEESFTAEQRRAATLGSEASSLRSETEKLTFALRSEEAASAALREQTGKHEATSKALRHENTELQARLGRIEPQLREVVAARDVLEVELADLRRAKLQVDEAVTALGAELGELRDELSSHENQKAALELTTQRQKERIDEAAKSISDLEASLQTMTDKFSFTSAALMRERNAVRALRAEVEQKTRERDESRVQFEAQIEAARARYDFVEKMLQETRSRFGEETRQLATARRERAESDRRIGQLTLSLEAVQREAAESRAQVTAASESAELSRQLLAAEIDQRRKAEMELDLLRTENSNISLKLNAANNSFSSIDQAIGEATQKFRAKISQLAAENEQLRATLNEKRNQEQNDFDKEFEFLFSDTLDKSQPAPKREDDLDDGKVFAVR